jgi:predicted transcriptional regulator YdeE
MQKLEIEPFKLIGIAIKTTNEGKKADKEIAELWQRFMRENLLEKIPNKVGNTIYSVYTEYEGDHTKPYTAILGCKVKNFDEIPDGMTAKSFDGGTYVKTTAKGDLMSGLIVKHWRKIWNMDLDRVYTADFEVYGKKAQNPSDAEVDFYIAVKE